MNLKGKTVLVTGATSGIGAALIRNLRDRGANVIGVGHNPERIAASRAAGFEILDADLSTLDGVNKLIGELESRPLDVLINNAGMGVKHNFRSEPPDMAKADRAIFLNFQAPVHLIAALLPRLAAQPQAAILNVTSVNALVPRGADPVYCATKAALRSYTQSLRHQLRDSRVRVIEALPPTVDTPMAQEMRGRIKMLSPQDCAERIVRGLEQEESEINIGLTSMVQKAYSVSPNLTREMMLRF